LYVSIDSSYPSNIPDVSDQNGELNLTGTASYISNAKSIRIFFDRDGFQNPGTGSPKPPNWFYYWLQTVTLKGPKPVVVYGSGSNRYDPNTNRIILTDSAKNSSDSRPYVETTLEGIDRFAWEAIHESQHYADYQDFWDVDNHGTAKRSQANGGTGPDDDKDGDFIPNRVEDVNLNGIYDTGDLYDWDNPNTPTPGRPINIRSDFEDWNCQRNKNVRGDHSQDWAKPGKQW